MVERLYRIVHRYHPFVAIGVSTILGKRPDLASLDRQGHLVIWEVKTRFEQYERRATWEKYHTSCDLLWLVYPPETQLFSLNPVGWLPIHPGSRRIGVMLLNASEVEVHRQPETLTPEPTALTHLTSSVMRKHGSTEQKFSVAGSN